MSELRFFITRFANASVVDTWVSELKTLPINKYERLALLAFFEESRRLIRYRDAIDTARDSIPSTPGTVWGWQNPSSPQQRALYDATKSYYDTLYSAISSLSGVVARFSTVFDKNFSNNGPFIKWMIATLDGLSHNAGSDLERARLFRALLIHPQQFPVFNWATACYPGNEQVHIVLHGHFSRGASGIPLGATKNHEWLGNLDDWQMEAPDEVSVTNSFFGASLQILARVVQSLTERSSFKSSITVAEATHRLNPPETDVSASARQIEGDPESNV